jgi:hypothetical protein
MVLKLPGSKACVGIFLFASQLMASRVSAPRNYFNEMGFVSTSQLFLMLVLVVVVVLLLLFTKVTQ